MRLVTAAGLGYIDGYQGRPCEIPAEYDDDEAATYLTNYREGSAYRAETI